MRTSTAKTCTLYQKRRYRWTHLVEDDKDELHHRLSRRWIGDGVVDRGEAHVAVPAGGAEQLALEAVAIVRVHHASNVRELHVCVSVWLRVADRTQTRIEKG